ncbi:MAG: FAD-dependent oxidoreductase [Actinobacteria bacterium]|nr:FAD-dependent oxidoreductase [Actinomycetota bacterium]
MTNGSEVDVQVLGAGVVGLTTAITLAEAGWRVSVRTASPPGATTSAAAGAVWGPVTVGPPGRCRDWARTGLDVLRDLARDPAAGIMTRSGQELSRVPASPPAWADLLDELHVYSERELPPGFAAGWRYRAPVVSMPVYLDYLVARLEQAGVKIDVNPITSLTEVADGADGAFPAPVIVNCTGVAARQLVPDPAVHPIRGQVVIIANPGIEEFYIDHSTPGTDLIYLFPHQDTVVLGGTMADGDWDTEPRPAVAERILAGCAAAEPRVRDAPVVAHRVGLRPARPEVRLEAEPLGDGRVLWHNYGHGGGGVTISWGCAREIAAELGRG